MSLVVCRIISALQSSYNIYVFLGATIPITIGRSGYPLQVLAPHPIGIGLWAIRYYTLRRHPPTFSQITTLSHL